MRSSSSRRPTLTSTASGPPYPRRSGRSSTGCTGGSTLLSGFIALELARALLGGNGILLDRHVARFVADAEALYSYEGTREINTLIVGRAITGFSAFV